MYLLALRLAELRGGARPRGARREDRRAQADSAPDQRVARRATREAVRARSPRTSTRPTSSCTSAATSGFPVALEGALKLKEISYIATDAYAAGEMKHGPIALLDEHTPVVVVATASPILEKVVSNMQEVRARGARVIAIATEGDDRDRRARRRGDPRAGDRLDAVAAAGGDPAAAARVPDRAQARPQRRPAAQPGQDGHRRVSGPAPSARVGVDLLEIDRLERALARSPAARRCACSPTASGRMPPRARGPDSTSQPASAPRRRSPRR